MAKLERKLGSGNYHYIVRVPDPSVEILEELEAEEAGPAVAEG